MAMKNIKVDKKLVPPPLFCPIDCASRNLLFDAV